MGHGWARSLWPGWAQRLYARMRHGSPFTMDATDTLSLSTTPAISLHRPTWAKRRHKWLRGRRPTRWHSAAGMVCVGLISSAAESQRAGTLATHHERAQAPSRYPGTESRMAPDPPTTSALGRPSCCRRRHKLPVSLWTIRGYITCVHPVEAAASWGKWPLCQKAATAADAATRLCMRLRASGGQHDLSLWCRHTVH